MSALASTPRKKNCPTVGAKRGSRPRKKIRLEVLVEGRKEGREGKEGRERMVAKRRRR
jgi:hypothetical protein